MRIGLIACSKRKLDHPAPAEELYIGPVFKLAKKWITRTGRVDAWAILSARHGLVMPDQEIEPYDVSLSSLPSLQKARWCDWVHEQLMDKWGEDAIYMVVAGADYRAALSQMSLVEDVIEGWTQMRMNRGMTRRRACVGIGVLKKLLKDNTGYGV